MSFPGRVNVYRCDDCDGAMVTIDVGEGDTPYLTRCLLRASTWIDSSTRQVGLGTVCGGRAVSSLYVVEGKQTASFEWYKPTEPEIARLRGFPRYQAQQGGLVLRPRGNP